MLVEAGYVFEQADPPFDDPPHPEVRPGLEPERVAEELAAAKAESVRENLGQNAVVLAADTICVGVDGQLIGQPDDAAEARRIIMSFTEAVHDVVTGVALVGPGADEPVVFADTASVRFGKLDDAALDAYLESGEWQGKAGGYNLFERQAAGWPIKVTGDPTTVVGLPMVKLAVALRRHGIEPMR